MGFKARAVLSALFVGLWLAGPACAEPVPVHVDTAQGFARLVFELEDAPPAPATIEYGVLILRFAAPTEIDVDALRAALVNYATIVRLDADKKTLRIALRGPVRLRETTVGPQLAVDILPPRFQGEPPVFNGIVTQAANTRSDDEPGFPSEARDRKEIARFDRPQPLLLVPVHVGQNPTYTRVVFDWPEAVGYSVDHVDNHVVVRFSKPARMDLSELRVDPPHFVKGAHAETADGGLSVIIETDPGLNVSDFRDGDRIAVDLGQKPPDATAAAPEQSEADSDAEATDEVTKPFEAPKPAQGSDAAALLNAEEASSPAKDEAAAATPPASSAPPTNTPGDESKGAPAAAPDANAQAAGAPEQAATDQNAAAAASSNAQSPAAQAPALPALQFAATKDGADIVLPWTEPVAASIFRRGEMLWLVFETDAALAAPPPGPELSYLFGDIDQSSTDGVQIVRIGIKGQTLIGARLDGARWIVHVGESAGAPPQSIEPVRESDVAGGTRLRFALGGKGLHWLKDPAAGDFIVVATAEGPVRSFARSQKLVEAETLESAHGLALVPFADNLKVVQEDGTVFVSAAEGLAVTAEALADRSSAHSPLERVGRPGFVDFAKWQGEGLAKFNEERMRLEAAIAAADGPNRDLKRLDLVHYYLANGLSEEALGLLEYMAHNDPRIATAPTYNALRGVALYFMRRYADAEQALDDASLAHDSDVWIWRAAVAAAEEKWASAARAFDASADEAKRYPPPIAARFRFAEAETALARGDFADAEAALAALPAEGLDRFAHASAEYLKGRILEGQGQPEAAVEHFHLAAQAPKSEVSARARLAEVSLLEKLGKLPRKDSIAALESLRFTWRGDAVEFATLAKLGTLYVDEKEYGKGLGVMHAATSYFPNLDGGSKVSAQMASVFRTLFLDGAADALSPVEALGLYYDYRELTPVGSDGDEMIRKLAERMVAVDLLPQAAELLQHQVDNRLQGAARSQVATRLAMIYLMDHKAEAALKALRSTRQAQLPDWLNAQRRLLEARALAELRQYDFALEVLVSDESKEAERIRADVYWGAENWPAAAEHIEAVLAGRWSDPRPLTSDERLQVMRAGLAYLFGKDAYGLERLRVRYGKAMEASEDKAAFILVTSKPDTSDSDLGELAKKLAATDTLDAFMAQFRAHYDTSTPAAPAAAVAPAPASAPTPAENAQGAATGTPSAVPAG